MTGKLESRRQRRSRSASSGSRSSSNDSRKLSRRYDSRYRSGRDRYRRSFSRSRSRSRSRSSSDDRGQGSSSKHGDRKKPLRTKYDDLMDKVKVKEEPVSDDDRSRTKSRYASTNVKSRYSDDDGDDRYRKNRSNEREDSWKSRKVKKERWGGGDLAAGGQDREHEWGKKSEGQGQQNSKKPLVDKAKPDFGLSGKLTEDANTYNGIVIKYSEPPEARKPKRRWRLYPFKGDESLKTLYIHRQSAYLIGRERKVADIPIDHPSCSKQHAALQYRLVTYKRDDGRSGKRICPYIIDLESANGTFVNNKKIEPKKYVELLERDVIKFGFSSREYVLLHEHSKDSGEDDNVFDNDNN